MIKFRRGTIEIKRGIFRGYNISGKFNYLYTATIDGDDEYFPVTLIYEDDFIESELKYERGLKLKELLS